MDRAYVEAAVGNLDAEIPKDNARVSIQLEGGDPGECSLVANELGYLRLGVEMLKAAFAPAGLGKQATGIPVELGYLMAEDSEVYIDSFQRRDPTSLPARAAYWGWPELAALAFGLFLVALVVIGFMTVVHWIGAALAQFAQ